MTWMRTVFTKAGRKYSITTGTAERIRKVYTLGLL
jgi:hypothetical protein